MSQRLSKLLKNWISRHSFNWNKYFAIMDLICNNLKHSLWVCPQLFPFCLRHCLDAAFSLFYIFKISFKAMLYCACIENWIWIYSTSENVLKLHVGSWNVCCSCCFACVIGLSSHLSNAAVYYLLLPPKDGNGRVEHCHLRSNALLYKWRMDEQMLA